MLHNRAVIRQVGLVALCKAACVAVMLLVYAVIGRFSLPVLWGGLLGGVLAALDFLFLSIAVTRAADRAEATGEAAKAKLSIQSSSAARLLLMALILIGALKLELCDPIAAVLPLLFPRPCIMLFEFFRKDGKTAQ